MGEVLTKSRAGISQQLTDEEFKFTLAAWLEVLEGHVPEARLNEVYVIASRTRNNTFPLTQFELCETWNQMRDAERRLPPAERQVWGKDVCLDCNGTGTRLFTNRDIQLGRDYVYSKPCQHLRVVQ